MGSRPKRNEIEDTHYLLQPYYEETTGLVTQLSAQDRIAIDRKHIDLLTSLTEVELLELDVTDRVRRFARADIRHHLALWLYISQEKEAAFDQLNLALKELEGLGDVGFNRSSTYTQFQLLEKMLARDTGDKTHLERALEYLYLSLDNIGETAEINLLLHLDSLARLLSEMQRFPEALNTYDIIRGLRPTRIEHTISRAALLKQFAPDRLNTETDYNHLDGFRRQSLAIAANLALGNRERARGLAFEAMEIAEAVGDEEWAIAFQEYIKAARKRGEPKQVWKQGPDGTWIRNDRPKT